MKDSSTTPVAPPDSSAKKSATILCVDDESNILTSLSRLLRPLGHRVITASSGSEGLKVLEREPIDVIISDMRMPEMDGAAFLEKAAVLQPHTVRLILTGYADINSTISAINRGGIFRYLSKPWEDNDLRLAVQQALKVSLLDSERRRLEDLTRKQNAELKELNTNLEAKVQARTGELSQLNDFLEVTHESLKKHFSASIKIFSTLIELRAGPLAGHSRRVAEHAHTLAIKLGMPGADAQHVQYAALLHDIGKLGLSDTLVQKPFNALTAEERADVVKHPLVGEAALMELEPLHDAAKLIRHHHERYDGQGYPDRLVGEQIPFGARVLAVANDYDALLIGILTTRKVSEHQARQFLIDNKGKRYDPVVVDAFVQLLGIPVKETADNERCIKSGGLEPGMVLTRDLVNRDGLILLNRGRALDTNIIKRLQDIERTIEWDFTVYIRA